MGVKNVFLFFVLKGERARRKWLRLSRLIRNVGCFVFLSPLSSFLFTPDQHQAPTYGVSQAHEGPRRRHDPPKIPGYPPCDLPELLFFFLRRSISPTNGKKMVPCSAPAAPLETSSSSHSRSLIAIHVFFFLNTILPLTSVSTSSDARRCRRRRVCRGRRVCACRHCSRRRGRGSSSSNGRPLVRRGRGRQQRLVE